MTKDYTFTHTLAQAYGEGSYSNNAYTTQQTDTQTEQPGGVEAPNTGFLQTADPTALVVGILGASILIAAAVALIKKLVKHSEK